MTLGMIAWALAASTLVLATAWGLARLARARRRQERWIWTLALALASGASWVPTVPQAPTRDAEMAELPVVEVAATEAVGASAATESGAVDRLVHEVEAAAAMEVPGFGIAWAVGALLLLTTLAGVELADHRRRRRLTAVRIWGYPARLDERDGPAVSGVIAPTLVVDRRALELGGARRRTLVTHELEHLRAGDVRLVATAYLMAILAPWNPLCWQLARRVSVATEADCDRRTLRRRPTSSRDYVELLLEVASWRTSSYPSLRLSMSGDARRLMRRLDLILPRRRRPAVVSSLLLLTGLAVVAPALADPPRVTAEAQEPVLPPPSEPAAVQLPAAPSANDREIDGRGAYTVLAGGDGAPIRIETEVTTSPAFEAVARAWLDRGVFPAGSEGTHVWVAATRGHWSAVPVSPELYASRSLGTDSGRLRSLLETWARLTTEPPIGLPTTASVRPDASVADTAGPRE